MWNIVSTEQRSSVTITLWNVSLTSAFSSSHQRKGGISKTQLWSATTPHTHVHQLHVPQLWRIFSEFYPRLSHPGFDTSPTTPTTALLSQPSHFAHAGAYVWNALTAPSLPLKTQLVFQDQAQSSLFSIMYWPFPQSELIFLISNFHSALSRHHHSTYHSSNCTMVICLHFYSPLSWFSWSEWWRCHPIHVGSLTHSLRHYVWKKCYISCPWKYMLVLALIGYVKKLQNIFQYILLELPNNKLKD